MANYLLLLTAKKSSQFWRKLQGNEASGGKLFLSIPTLEAGVLVLAKHLF
ncbi:hypothetical protein [Microscilla marina]|uniref:Uncharacterized protein n=1 Tax=Microscilla marina ATCC 23134 TaxID=313606 RepID=A1ZD28_MICM2|nr:hypothetical protein [Microscilla marina]EAY31567.1 hypothetical protein M23134_05073 [Microscilla marina ATCC 23134]